MELLHELMPTNEKDLWSKLFNISSDGPHINRKVHRLLDQELRKSGHNGLLPFIGCTLHTMHNGYHKGIKEMSANIEDLVYDLHAWFKNSPCKEEDFRSLNDEISIDESLFLKHVSTRWLTLSPAFKRILDRWDSCKRYFVTYLPTVKEYKNTLPKNARYQRILKHFKEYEMVNFYSTEIVFPSLELW